MTIEAVGGGTRAWEMPASADVSAAPAGRDVADGGEATATVADRALELVEVGDERNADAAVHNAMSTVRGAARERTEMRARIREIERKLADAQAHASIWDKIASAFKWIGTALGALAGVAATVVTCGAAGVAAVAGTVALVTAAAGGGAGAAAALAGYGAGTLRADAAELEADRMVADDVVQSAQQERTGALALAQSVAQAEEAMRQQAMSWIDREDAARRTAASLAAAR